jgi:DNA-binding beta-propeller fold protein YncE
LRHSWFSLVTPAAWYQWFPDDAYDFEGITFSPGDNVVITVSTWDSLQGSASVYNENTRQVVSQQITAGSSAALCQQDAEWIVEDFEENGSPVPFADFGTVTFTGATAQTFSGVLYGPAAGIPYEIYQEGMALTSVSIPKGYAGSYTINVSYI